MIGHDALTQKGETKRGQGSIKTAKINSNVNITQSPHVKLTKLAYFYLANISLLRNFYKIQSTVPFDQRFLLFFCSYSILSRLTIVTTLIAGSEKDTFFIMENTITDILFNRHLSTMHAVPRVDKIIVKVSYHMHLYSTLALLQRVYYN